MTALDIIKASLRLIGVLASGETPTGAMASDALQTLNSMLSSWQNEGLLSLTEQQNFSVSAGTSSYTIGSGQTWNGHKPLRIINAKIRDSANKDYPLKQISYSDYARVFSKDDTGIPYVFAYFPVETTGTVYLHFKPVSYYTITLLSQKPFSSYRLTDEINLPSGYEAAIKYNLALELSPEYGSVVNQVVIKLADDYLVKIKKTNLKRPSKLQYDNIFDKKQNYDVVTDTYY